MLCVAGISSSSGIIHLNKPNGSLKSEQYYLGGDVLFCGDSCEVSLLWTVLN